MPETECSKPVLTISDSETTSSRGLTATPTDAAPSQEAWNSPVHSSSPEFGSRTRWISSASRKLGSSRMPARGSSRGWDCCGSSFTTVYSISSALISRGEMSV